MNSVLQKTYSVVWRVLLVMLTFLLLDYISMKIVGTRAPGHVLLFREKLWDETRILIVVLATIGIIAWIDNEHLLSFGFGGPSSILRLIIGALFGFGLSAVLVIALIMTNYLVPESSTASAEALVRAGAQWGSVFLLLSIAEEFLFRGCLQTTISRFTGFWPAACLSSLLFGFAHLANRVDVWFHVVSASLVGLVFSLALYETGSLWWGIGFHAAWDWTQAFLFGTSAGGHVLDQTPLRTLPVGDSNWSGGSAGPDASFAVVPILGAAALVVVYVLKRIKLLRHPLEKGRE